MKLKSISISAFIFKETNKGLKYLLLKRTLTRGCYWQSVSGRIENNESAIEAAKREVYEETGLTSREIVDIDYINTFYELDTIFLEPCFGIRVESERVKISDEHTEHKWLGFEDAVKTLKWNGNKRALEILNQQLCEKE